MFRQMADCPAAPGIRCSNGLPQKIEKTFDIPIQDMARYPLTVQRAGKSRDGGRRLTGLCHRRGDKNQENTFRKYVGWFLMNKFNRPTLRISGIGWNWVANNGL